ncbi:putative ribonuclease H-like domain-containing protein [Tanacetum coccineum]
MSENEDQYHDIALNLKAKVKKNMDTVLKIRNSLQGMFMLGPKPMSFYDSKLKHGLGYKRDTENILEDATKSLIKLKNKMKDPIAIEKKQNVSTIDYKKLNALYEDFVPQKEHSAEQKYFPHLFISPEDPIMKVQTYFSFNTNPKKTKMPMQPNTCGIQQEVSYNWDNTSLKFQVQSLIKERENVKTEYQKLFDSIKKTRAQPQREINELIENVKQNTYAYADVRAQNQDLLLTISELKAKLKTVENGLSATSSVRRTMIVEENLHVQFSENTPNIVGSGPNWLFDIDALTKSMNYKPVVVGNQSNGNAGTKACDNAGKARMETVPDKDYILLPLWTADLPFSQSLKSSPDAGLKPLRDDENKVTKEPGKEGGDPSKEGERDDQEKDVDVNITNNIVYSDDDEDVGAEADMNNLDVFMPVSPIPTTRVYKDHPDEQIGRTCAFLYGKIEEEVYVCQPLGFEDLDFLDRVYKVEKALYGLHQAPRAWYETLLTYLLDNEFQRGKIDKTLFIKRYKDEFYGRTYIILGLQVQQKKDGIFISQDKYVCEILKKFRFTEVKTASTTMETQKPLLKDKDGEEVDVHMYRDLQLEDAEGVDCLPNSTIFEQLTLMSSKTTAWNEFSSTMASSIICLATNQKFNFSKYIFENETVYKELDDSLVRAATTASSLEAVGNKRILNCYYRWFKLQLLVVVTAAAQDQRKCSKSLLLLE